MEVKSDAKKEQYCIGTWNVRSMSQDMWRADSLEKTLKCSTWIQSQKDRMISVCLQGKPFNITVIQVYAQTSNTEEAELNGFMKTYKTF